MDITLINETGKAKLAEDRIYVCVIGRAVNADGTPGCWSYLNNVARLIQSRYGDNTSAYFFTASDFKAQQYKISGIPPIISGRIYVAYGQLLQISIRQDSNQPCGYGVAFPNVSDANSLTSEARVTSPTNLPASVDFPIDYFKMNIDAFWSRYSEAILTVSVANMGGPPTITTASGRVLSWVPGVSGVFRFTDNLGNNSSINYPISANVFGCDGDRVFNIDANLPAKPLDLQAVDGNIKKQIAAALNRSVEGNDPATWCDSSNY